MGRLQLANITSWFATYQGALTDLRRCARLDADGFWVFIDGYSVSDKAVREYYAIEEAG
jgi:hypothetical protein